MGTYKACLPIMLRGTTRHNTNRHDRGLRCAINLLCEMTTFWMERQFRVISLHGATRQSFHAAINSARAATVQHFCNTPKNETSYSYTDRRYLGTRRGRIRAQKRIMLPNAIHAKALFSCPSIHPFARDILRSSRQTSNQHALFGAGAMSLHHGRLDRDRVEIVE